MCDPVGIVMLRLLGLAVDAFQTVLVLSFLGLGGWEDYQGDPHQVTQPQFSFLQLSGFCQNIFVKILDTAKIVLGSRQKYLESI